MTLAGALSGIDFTDLDNFANGFPHELFAVHRREAPVYWHQPTEHTPDAEGFWSISTYAETLAVLKDPVTFSSVTGGDRPFGGTLLQDLAIAGQGFTELRQGELGERIFLMHKNRDGMGAALRIAAAGRDGNRDSTHWSRRTSERVTRRANAPTEPRRTRTARDSFENVKPRHGPWTAITREADESVP